MNGIALDEHLHVKDFRSLRLTCKILSARATAKAFHEVKVWLECESLQKLINNAKHAQL